MNIGSIARIDLPAPWRALAVPVGVPLAAAFAPALDVEQYGEDLRSLPLVFSVSVGEATPGRTASQFGPDLMSRRVRQGYPDQFEAMVDGRSSSGYDWTDGIADIL